MFCMSKPCKTQCLWCQNHWNNKVIDWKNQKRLEKNQKNQNSDFGDTVVSPNFVFFGFSNCFCYVFLKFTGFSMVFFGFSLVFLGFHSLAPSGEGGGSSQDKAQALRSSKQLQNDSFSKLFVRVSRGGIGERSSCIWAPGYSSSSLWPTLETVARAAQKCPRRPRAPKSFKTIAFQCL